MRERWSKVRVLFFAVLWGTVMTSSAQVVISEFMAANHKTLLDGDGNYSDWIELYNTGSSSVDLTGWYLSDSVTNLTQWAFPSVSIAAGEFMVVFSSGQEVANYTDSLGYYHTSFKLSASGESVVLTQADGVTIEDAFLNYPAQEDDISYGLAQDSSLHSLIAEGEDATAYVGTSEPSSTWNTINFSDAGWLSGTTGVGFERVTTGRPRPGETVTTPVYENLIGLDVTAMSGQTDSAYIRVNFSVDAADDISQLGLRMKYDDGFVAYVNGQQVAMANAPATLSSGSSASAEHDGTSYEDFTVINADSFLQSGDNVLAIHGLNMANDTQDFFMMPILSGISVGAIQTGTSMYFSSPSPGSDNVFGVLGYVADTTFSVDRGFFTTAFDVEITCETEGAEIYYTVDATTPATDNGTLYTGPIQIDHTTVLRAAAFKTGYQPSNADTQSYIFLSDIISQGTNVGSLAPEFPASAVNGQDFDYGMDTAITQSGTYASQLEGALKAIPSLSIVTDPDNLFDASTGMYVNPEESGEAWEREMSLELINPDGTDGFQINGGMRIRGASSARATNPKHSFRFFFRSEYGTSRLKYPLFGDTGVDSFKRMDLRTGQNFSWANQTPEYATWLYDIFTRDTHRDMNQPYTRGEYYHLYINGMYWGLYQTEERCNAEYAESYYGDDASDFDAIKSDADTGDMYAVDGTRDAYDDLWAAAAAGFSSDSAYFAAQGMNADGTRNSTMTRLLDVDNVIDYMLLVYFTANRDSPVGPPMNTPTMPRNLNVLYNRTNPDGFKFVAHDNEHSLEVSEGVDHNRINQTLGSSFDTMDYFNPWSLHLKLMANDEYALRFADHVHEHFFNNGALTASVTANRIEVRKNEIYAAVVAESARWGDSASTTTRTRDDDWLTWANWLTDTYMSQRSDIVLGQIKAKGWYPTVDAPEFNQHGGSIDSGFSLSISKNGGTIYYTTDGTDPREVGGNAVGNVYTGSISLNRTTQVKARVLSGGIWSALTDATFVLNEASPLRVTEIMYHPAGPSTTGGEAAYTASDFEFLELLNTGTETVGLAGTAFSSGIRMDLTDGDVATLAPGEYAVLVSNYAAFTNRYSNWSNINIVGQYHGQFFIQEGSLDNSGERITLVDGNGLTILDFEYDDWYEITDGDGYSLTLIDPLAATNTWSESASWRPSAYTDGTPGAGAFAFPATGDLVINEALTHQDQDNPGDWIELYNTSDSAIDINGWFLSDDEDTLDRVELSGLATIAPGEYLVLTEAAHFGLTAAGTNGFALSELGENIYLSSGENGELTGYRVEVSFGAAERDVTFGRHVKSDGTSDFTAQSAQTSGATNAYPLIGDIAFTEIMYHPASSNDYEYIEIANRTSSAVKLYHPTETTHTWKLDGAVEFTFPAGLTLAAGECILITETNAAAFRSCYSVDAGVTVLGPYSGKLDNAGEDLLLTRPGDEEALTGEVPYILVERVDYDNTSPWATDAAGLGSSLSRIDNDLYSNDSTNWSAEDPTPGTADGTVVNLDSDSDGLPDAWEILYFGSINAVDGDATDDGDSDGTTNYEEWRAGTDPTDPDSAFEFVAIAVGTESIFSWTSETGKLYSLWTSTNLVLGFTLKDADIASTPPLNTYTTTVENVDCTFYKMTVDDE